MGRGKRQFERLMEIMPEGWEEKAKELGALQRAREIKTPGDLLRLILLYLTEGKSFAGTSAITQMSGDFKLNKTAVYKRIQASAEWLKWLCRNIDLESGLLAPKPAWLAGKEVCLVDGSEDVICGSRKAYFRLHSCLDLFTLGIRELRVTDIKTGEKLSNFTKLGERDIVLGDRIYGTLPGIEYLRGLGSGYAIRLRANGFSVYDGNGQKTSLLRGLKGLKAGESRDFEVYYRWQGEYIPLRVCGMRKDRTSERAGLKRLTKENQRKRQGKEVSKKQKAYNRYIIVGTSLGPEVTTSQVLELYRMRWQIEIAFKRLKSLFQYNEIPMKLDKTAYAWFYGKLLLAALCERIVNEGRFSPSGGTGKTRS
jgi:hypothetical protein